MLNIQTNAIGFGVDITSQLPDPCAGIPFTREREDYSCDSNCDCDLAAGRQCGYRSGFCIGPSGGR
eukprot:Pgem_evm1s15958